MDRKSSENNIIRGGGGTINARQIHWHSNRTLAELVLNELFRLKHRIWMVGVSVCA